MSKTDGTDRTLGAYDIVSGQYGWYGAMDDRQVQEAEMAVEKAAKEAQSKRMNTGRSRSPLLDSLFSSFSPSFSE